MKVFFLGLCLLVAAISVNSEINVVPNPASSNLILVNGVDTNADHNNVVDGKVVMDATQFQQLMNMLHGQGSITILNAVSSGTPVTIKNTIETGTATINDWQFVFQQVFDKNDAQWGTLLNTGSQVNYGNQKIVFYLSLVKFLESQKDNPMVAQVLGVRQPGTANINLDALLSYNPTLQFTKLEDQLLAEIGGSVSEALTSNQLVGSKSLNTIPWSDIWQHDISKPASEPLLLQKVLTDAVLKHWDQIDLAKIAKQLNQIPNDSDNDKVKKLYLYIALLNAANQNIKNNVKGYLPLATSFNDFQKNVQFNNGADKAQNAIQQLNNGLHGCAKSIINHPPNTAFTISNRFLNEPFIGFFATHEDRTWNIVPKDLTLKTYRPVFLWSRAVLPTPERCTIAYEFDRDSDNARFWLRPKGYNNLYLQFGHKTDGLLEVATSPLDKNAFELIPSNLYDDACHIVNIPTGRILDAAKEFSDYKYRIIKVDGDCYGPRTHWSFKPFAGGSTECRP